MAANGRWTKIDVRVVAIFSKLSKIVAVLDTMSFFSYLTQKLKTRTYAIVETINGNWVRFPVINSPRVISDRPVS